MAYTQNCRLMRNIERTDLVHRFKTHCAVLDIVANGVASLDGKCNGSFVANIYVDWKNFPDPAQILVQANLSGCRTATRATIPSAMTCLTTS